MGRVGNILCRYLNAFNAKVRYFDTDGAVACRYDAEKTASIEELIDKSEIVFLCAAYSKENEQFISRITSYNVCYTKLLRLLG